MTMTTMMVTMATMTPYPPIQMMMMTMMMTTTMMTTMMIVVMALFFFFGATNSNAVASNIRAIRASSLEELF